MANSRNDDMDRIGNRSTPQGRDTVKRDRDIEEGRNITNQGRDRTTGTDWSRGSDRDSSDESE